MSTKTLFAASAGFEAARHVDILPVGHRSRRMHGHSFRANLRCALPTGWARFPGGEVEHLRSTLEARIAQLDYRLLNETVAQPTDENLARWVRRQLDVPGIEQVGIPQIVYDHPRSPFVYEFLGNVNRLGTGPEARYVRPHEIEVLFAAECDTSTDQLARVQHLFSAGPVATLSVRLDDGQFLDINISRKQLDDLAISIGDEIAVRLPPQ